MDEALCGFDSTPQVHGSDLLVFLGPTVMVNIGFDPDWRPDPPGATPVLPEGHLMALVDTGAQASCIDQMLAASLGLPVVDRQSIAGSNGAHEVNMYLAQIHLPALGFTQHGQFAGVDLQAGGQAHRALIGRTFLRGFELHYEGHSGTVRLKKVEATALPPAP